MELAKSNFALLADTRATRTAQEQPARRFANFDRGQAKSFRSVLARRTKGQQKDVHSAEQRTSRQLKPLQEQPAQRDKDNRLVDAQAEQPLQRVEQPLQRQPEQQTDQAPADENPKAMAAALTEAVERQAEQIVSEDELETAAASVVETAQSEETELTGDDQLSALLAALFGEIKPFVDERQMAQTSAEEQRSGGVEVTAGDSVSSDLLRALSENVDALRQAAQGADLEAAQTFSQLEEMALKAEQVLKQIATLTEGNVQIAPDDLETTERVDLSEVKLALSDLIAQFRALDGRVPSRSTESAAIEQVLESDKGAVLTVETNAQPNAQGGLLEEQLNDNSDVKQHIKSVERRGEGVVFDISGENSEQFVSAAEETLDNASQIAKATSVKNQNGLALRTEIFDQVKAAIVKSNTIVGSDDHSEMIIRLKPEELGKVELKIEVHNDNVIARFNVASQVVKEAIESNLQDLRNSLKDKGFSEMSFDVDVNQGGDGQSAFQQNNGRRRAVYVPADVEKGEASYIKSLSAMINDASFEYLA